MADPDPVEGHDAEDISLVDVKESRLAILQALDGNRRTASELARELDLTRSTVHGYVQDLVEDGFLQRHEDEDRLWVYYSLTEEGQQIVDDDRLTLIINLATLLAGLGALGFAVYQFLTMDRDGIDEVSRPLDPGLPWGTIVLVGLIALTLVGIGARWYIEKRRSGEQA